MEALALGPGVQVQEVNERAEFVSLAKEWDELVRRTRDEPFHRHEFLRIWIDNFAPSARLRVLIGRDAGGRLVAALPLYEDHTRMYGVPVRLLSTTANAHSCRFDLLADDPASASRAFLAHLERDAQWDLLRLTDVPEGGGGWQLHAAAQERGMPVGTWPSLDSPYIELPASSEALQERLQAKFKANCRRRRRKLEEKGPVEFERVEGGEALDFRLEEGFALEQSGWKGRNGTAMAQDRATRGFYSELARTARYGGYLSLYFLRLGGRPVAFHYGLTYGERYFLLKPAYDESLSECSPGQLLMEEVVRDCIRRGLREFDFLGPDMPWKRDWTNRSRKHSWIFVFGDTRLGRALCGAKFRWLPAAKEVVRRWKR